MTQQEMIHQHLQSGKSITPLEALQKYGCFRLAAIIHSLRGEGQDIETKMVSNGKKQWASYKLKTKITPGGQYAFA